MFIHLRKTGFNLPVFTLHVERPVQQEKYQIAEQNMQFSVVHITNLR